MAAGMSETRIPKISLFSWSPQLHPRGGPRRWRDVIQSDLKKLEISENVWHHLRLNGGLSIEKPVPHSQGTTTATQLTRHMPVCLRSFRRESGLKRHKCLEERWKPVSDQRGEVQCPRCQIWFGSREDFTVHTCRPDTS